MTKLPKSIIKKYGISKKAWQVFKKKSSGHKKKKKSHSIKLKPKRRYIYMAKKKKKRSHKRGKSMFGINTGKAVGAVLYGLIRSKTSQMIAPYTSKIPLGSISDEVGMVAAATLAKKFLFKGSGTLRDAMTIGQFIELARIGDAAINGEINLGGAASSNNGYTFY